MKSILKDYQFIFRSGGWAILAGATIWICIPFAFFHEPGDGVKAACYIGIAIFATLFLLGLVPLPKESNTEPDLEDDGTWVDTYKSKKRPDMPATRQWVEQQLNAKTSNSVKVQPAIETKKAYSGYVVFRGERIAISIDKSQFYGYDTTDGGRIDFDPKICKLTGEIWIDDRPIAQTRGAQHVSEVVTDIQAMLNSCNHLKGELLLQVRTEWRRYINSDDAKNGYPRAFVGNMTLFVGSSPTNFEMHTK